MVKFVIEEGQERLRELQNWGTLFDTQQKELHLTKEGGHSEKRIVHYKDQTGLQIQEALIKKIQSFANVRCLENHILVDLITDHHTKTNHQKCYGAYVISKEKEEILTIGSKVTILSTGVLDSSTITLPIQVELLEMDSEQPTVHASKLKGCLMSNFTLRLWCPDSIAVLF